MTPAPLPPGIRLCVRAPLDGRLCPAWIGGKGQKRSVCCVAGPVGRLVPVVIEHDEDADECDVQELREVLKGLGYGKIELGTPHWFDLLATMRRGWDGPARRQRRYLPPPEKAS